MPRRGENIRKRKDGRWEARYISGRNSCGKAIYRSVYGKSYTETREKLKLEQLKSNTKTQTRNQMSCKELLNEWLQNNKVRYKQSTYTKYQYLIERHLIPVIGEMQVSSLNVAEINAILGNKLKEGELKNGKALSPAYVRTMALIIKSALNYAAIEEICHPMKSEILKPAIKQNRIATLSHMEFCLLSDYCHDHLNATSIGILIAMNTGLRVGEICALRWEDVDTDDHLLHVNNTVSRIKNDKDKCTWILETPKTASSLRDIPLSQALTEDLLQMRECSGSDYVVSGNETFINPRTFEYRYHKILSDSKVADINFHALRHTFATRCVEGGMDVKTLSEILGHSSASITLNTYVHSSMELKKNQMKKVENFFNRGQNQGQ